MRDEPTVIGARTIVRGRITGATDVSVRGRVEGDVVLDGRLEVADGGVILGDVDAPHAHIDGVVVGDVTVQSRLTLGSTAQIRGKVVAPRLEIAAGARVAGEVDTTGVAARTERAAPRPTPSPFEPETIVEPVLEPSVEPTPTLEPTLEPAPVATDRPTTQRKRLVVRTNRRGGG